MKTFDKLRQVLSLQKQSLSEIYLEQLGGVKPALLALGAEEISVTSPV